MAEEISPKVVLEKIEDLIAYLFDNGADRCVCDYYRRQICNMLFEFLEHEKDDRS